MPDPAITRHQEGPRYDAGQVTGTDPRQLADLTEEQQDQAMARKHSLAEADVAPQVGIGDAPRVRYRDKDQNERWGVLEERRPRRSRSRIKDR